MTNNEIIDLYISFLPFLSSVLGANTEIVIHNLTNKENSLVAIENSLSGRKVGEPLNKSSLELVKKGIEENVDYIDNYRATSKGKEFISYTYFIKNDGEIIGLLCINRDTKDSNQAINIIKELINNNNLILKNENKYHEIFDSSVENFVKEKISNVIVGSGIDVSMMSVKAKQEIVYKLNDEGTLKQKGAILEAAEQLNISVPTIYRYLNKREN